MSFYRQLLRWLALPVTDRRWAAPLAATALGFGLFVGIALGPGTSGSLATNVAQIVEEVEPAAEGGGEGEDGEGASEELGGGEEPSGFEEEDFEESEAGFEESFEFEEAEPEAETEPFAETTTPPAEPEEEEAAPSQPEAETVSGIVIQVNPDAGSYALVEAGGNLVAIHARKLPLPGSEVSVPVIVLANGTLAEEGKRKATSTEAEASFNGTVSYVDADPAAPAYVVSKRGVSVLVHVPPDPAGALPALPVLGAYATVEVAIEAPAPEMPAPVEPVPPVSGCVADPAKPLPPTPKPAAVLWQRQFEADGAPFTFSDFAGVVTAVCPDEGKLLISADQGRASEAELAFTVPRGIETKELEVGESVTATATIEADGTLVLTGLASDEKVKGADDPEATQGDLVNHNEE